MIRLGMAEELSRQMGARYLHIGDLRSDTIKGAVRGIGM